MKWVGVFLLTWFIVLVGGGYLLSWACTHLGVPPYGILDTVLAILHLVGSFVVSLLFTRWLRRQAARGPRPWPEQPPAFPGDEERDARIAASIARSARAGMFLGVGIGLACSVAMAAYGGLDSGKVRFRAIYLTPLTLGGAGFFLGLSAACLFAPGSFLTGPVGRPYMEMIGTRSVGAARAACLLFGLVVGVPLLALTALFAVVAYRG